jgi:small subunit ribosomal protein S9
MAEVSTPTKINKNFFFAVGRRKQAVARVRLYKNIPGTLSYGDHSVKKGDIFVNEKNISDYFSGDISRALYEKPFKTVEALGKFAVTIKVKGGGTSSQLEAVVHGLSRALSLVEPSFRSSLKKAKLLTRDQRKRQRRMVGMGGKSRAKKQSPKR